MSNEQINFSFLNEEENKDIKEKEEKTEATEEVTQQPKKEEEVDLSFKCEICSNQGCDQCGWGREKGDL